MTDCGLTLAKILFTPVGVVCMFVAYLLTWTLVSLLFIIMFTFGPLICAIKDTMRWPVYFWTRDENENTSIRLDMALDILMFIFRTVRNGGKGNNNNNNLQTPLVANPV